MFLKTNVCALLFKVSTLIFKVLLSGGSNLSEKYKVLSEILHMEYHYNVIDERWCLLGFGRYTNSPLPDV